MPDWTQAQKLAIYTKWIDEEKTKSSNILVNAAAGSGKTAVLVERIINKLTSPKGSADYCDADKLLVVTFTNAAAKEMQQRIQDSISKKEAQAIADNDYAFANHLNHQSSLIQNADITTIDAFCMKTIKNYFHLLEIDPNFSIVDSAEAEMLKDEVMEELYEENYANADFLKLLCLFSSSRDEKGLALLIKQIFNFTRSQPYPSKWFREKSELLKSNENNSPYLNILKEYVNEYLLFSLDYYKEALNIMINVVTNTSIDRSGEEIENFIQKNPPENDNDLHYSFIGLYKVIYNEYFFAKSLQDKDWDSMHKLLSSFVFEKSNVAVKPKKKELEITDKEVLDVIKELRADAKDVIKDKIKSFFTYNSDDVKRVTEQYLIPTIECLIKYCTIFDEKYTKLKNEKNIYEFYDIEHLCLKLFDDFPEVRKELKEKYCEILMDEYQDTNALQEEIFTKISRGDNFFIVGDMKQSIYRFRSSDPDLFKRKCDLYKKEEGSLNRKIILSQNFRSRYEVLDGINSIFEKLMCESIGGIDYDDDQMLYYDKNAFEDKNENYPTQNKCECNVILSYNDNGIKINDKVLEARFIAKKIRQMYDSKFLVKDTIKEKTADSNGNITTVEKTIFRPVKFKDFVIIMSSYKNYASIYQKELANYSITCLAQTGGYFDRPEIMLALSLLKAIDNPYNDISLIAVLRSPLFNFSDDELSVIRGYSTESFYDALKSVSEDNISLYSKCSHFLQLLRQWRYQTKIMSCDKLIWTVYEETNIYAFCEAAYGPEATSNLRLLFSRANAYESSGYKGLFNFIRYINKMKSKETDLNAAAIASENNDVVRIMTIHKSKGLEFPVVFFAGASKRFITEDIKGKLIIDKDMGIGCDYINFEKSYNVPTLQKNAISLKLKKDMISEEIRKLYVALTRAKEKLIVTATVKSKPSNSGEFIPQKTDVWMNSLDNKTKFLKTYSKNCDCFIDWIAPVAMRDNKNWVYNIIPYEEASYYKIIVDDDFDIQSKCKTIEVSDKSYQNEEMTNIPVKISVTDIARMSELKSTTISSIPKFITEEKGLTGAQIGTIMHYVMQKFVPFENMTIEDIDNFIQSMVKDGELTQTEANSINSSYIYDFYNCELGKRILKSNKVVREVAFEYEISANSVYDVKSDEKIILQGIIDCYFYEGDDIILVDYKTDKYTDIDVIKQKYAQQISYYKQAIENITKKRVKNSFLYLFSSKSVIQY